MEKFRVLEKKEKFGRNIEVSVHFVRHGKKDEHGGLSETGRLEAEEFGKGLEDKDAVKGYTSVKDRVKQTTEAIIKKSQIENKLITRVREKLSPSIVSSDFEKSKYFQEVDRKMSEVNSLPEDKRAKALEKVEEEYMKEWLGYDDKRPDEWTASPAEVAQNMASMIDVYTRMPERLKNDSRVDLVNVTHEYMLAAIVKYLLKKEAGEKVITGDKLIQDIGRIGYLEDIQIQVKINEAGEKQIKVLLRGEEYQLDLEKVQQFKELNKKTRK